MDRKVSQSSLAQEQGKFGSKNTLNRRVKSSQPYLYWPILPLKYYWVLEAHITVS